MIPSAWCEHIIWSCNSCGISSFNNNDFLSLSLSRDVRPDGSKYAEIFAHAYRIQPYSTRYEPNVRFTRAYSPFDSNHPICDSSRFCLMENHPIAAVCFGSMVYDFCCVFPTCRTHCLRIEYILFTETVLIHTFLKNWTRCGTCASIEKLISDSFSKRTECIWNRTRGSRWHISNAEYVICLEFLANISYMNCAVEIELKWENRKHFSIIIIFCTCTHFRLNQWYSMVLSHFVQKKSFMFLLDEMWNKKRDIFKILHTKKVTQCYLFNDWT